MQKEKQDIKDYILKLNYLKEELEEENKNGKEKNKKENKINSN